MGLGNSGRLGGRWRAVTGCFSRTGTIGSHNKGGRYIQTPGEEDRLGGRLYGEVAFLAG